MATLTIKRKDGTDAEVQAVPVQVGAALHGNHVFTPLQVDLTANVNPATGLPFAQVNMPTKGGQISPPPSRNFR